MSVILRRVNDNFEFVAEHEFRQATLVVRHNEAGTFSVTLSQDKSKGLVRGTNVIFSDNEGTILSGVISRRHRQEDPRTDDKIVTIEGRSHLHLLNGRLVYPDPTKEADHLDQPAVWDQEGPAGEVLAEMVEVNAGPTALEARRIPTLEVADATGLGTSVTARRVLPVILDEISRLGNPGAVSCDLFQPDDEHLLRFVVREIEDLSDEVFFSPGRGNLYGFELETTTPGATFVVVGGRGEGDERHFRVREREVSTWGRIETFVDARNVGDPGDTNAQHREDLDNEGDGALLELAAQENMTAEVVDLPDSPVRWRRDYNLGDVVGVLVEDEITEPLVAQVTEVTVSVAGNNGVTYTPTVGKVSPKRRLKIFDRIAQLESRVDNQARSGSGGGGGTSSEGSPSPHLLGGAHHASDTLANLNDKISDATLDDSSASRPPTTHGNEAHSPNFATESHHHDSDYSAISHDHDADYSDVNHDHDADYSSVSHHHDSDYASTGHDHDSDYADVAHDHDDDYSETGHTHAITIIAARIRSSSNQSIPHNSTTQLTFNTTDYDLDSMADLSNNRITCTTAGLYSCKFFARMNPGSGTRVQVRIEVNGNTITLDDRISPGGTCGFNTTADVFLEPGDHVTALMFQDSGNPVNTAAALGAPALSVSMVGVASVTQGD